METGGGLSLPVWISYMEHALKDVPVAQYAAPEGVLQSAGEWFYEEYARGAGVISLGLGDKTGNPAAAAVPGTQTPPTDEKKKILDLFRN